MNRSDRLSTSEVWERFSTGVLAFVRRRVRDEHVAADLLQEIFLRVHAGVAALQDDDRVLAWVYRIARNVLADHFRRPRRERAEAGLESPHKEEDPRDGYNQVVGGWLLHMLPRLPPRYREAVELAEVEGLPQKEIARRLGLSLSGAKSRVQRGREMLKALLLACCHLEFDARGNVLECDQGSSCPGCEEVESD